MSKNFNDLDIYNNKDKIDSKSPKVSMKYKEILKFIETNIDNYAKIYIGKNLKTAYVSVQNKDGSTRYDFKDVNFFDLEIVLKIVETFNKKSGIVNIDGDILNYKDFIILFNGYDNLYLDKIKTVVENANLIKKQNIKEIKEEPDKAYISLQVIAIILILSILLISMVVVAK